MIKFGGSWSNRRMGGFSRMGRNGYMNSFPQAEGLFRKPTLMNKMNYEGISRYAGMGMAALGGINTYSNLRDRRFGSAMFSAGMGGLGVYMTSKAGQQATARTLRSIVGQVTAKAAQFKK